MPPRGGIVGRNPHQAVHAAFGLHPAVGSGAGEPQGHRFDPRLLAFAFFQVFDLEAATFRPAHVHARQNLRPVLGLGAARPGVDFHIGVVLVGLAGEQGSSFRRRACSSRRASAASASATISASPRRRPSRSAPGCRRDRFPAAYSRRSQSPAWSARASGSGHARRRSTDWGLRKGRSVRPDGDWLHPSQRCLLSRAIACRISWATDSISARIGVCPRSVFCERRRL